MSELKPGHYVIVGTHARAVPFVDEYYGTGWNEMGYWGEGDTGNYTILGRLEDLPGWPDLWERSRDMLEEQQDMRRAFDHIATKAEITANAYEMLAKGCEDIGAKYSALVADLSKWALESGTSDVLKLLRKHKVIE